MPLARPRSMSLALPARISPARSTSAEAIASSAAFLRAGDAPARMRDALRAADVTDPMSTFSSIRQSWHTSRPPRHSSGARSSRCTTGRTCSHPVPSSSGALRPAIAASESAS